MCVPAMVPSFRAKSRLQVSLWYLKRLLHIS